MRLMHIVFIALVILQVLACDKPSDPTPPTPPTPPDPPAAPVFLRGADLSYVNEMEDCEATYLDSTGEEVDPYVLFAEAGTNLVRVRLWHTPSWTDYSDLADVLTTIRRAKAEGMAVLLDFHYSDDWADPDKQQVPAAWLPVVGNIPQLMDSVYNYTYGVMEQLDAEGLLPEYVQVGNETNIEILQDPDGDYARINWSRNAALLNRGIKAVRDAATAFDTPIEVMLHVAQPENARWWFAEATESGVRDYDWIAISYYPKWSEVPLEELDDEIKALRTTYSKSVVVVETAYPYTLDNQDAANNILGQDAALAGYPVSEVGQYAYLQDLEAQILAGGGQGLVYWEPAWVSNTCSTRWGQGSHWDNATLFRADGRPTVGMAWYGE